MYGGTERNMRNNASLRSGYTKNNIVTPTHIKQTIFNVNDDDNEVNDDYSSTYKDGDTLKQEATLDHYQHHKLWEHQQTPKMLQPPIL